MPTREDLVRFEELMARHLVDGDLGALRREAEALPEELRAAAAHIDERGFRITVLLCAKLRFERLTHGSRRALEWFERDPAGFTESFRRYHHEVTPTAEDPRGEAALFERWCSLSSGTRTNA
ncbi:MAG: hypothetical protein U1F36_18570 [Planctomycetota bacterium]